MAEKVVVDFSLGNLRQQLKEATLQAQELSIKFGATSKEAVEASKRAAALKHEIAEVNQTINALNPEEKFRAVVGVASGLAGGFSAATGAMALFGAESGAVEKALLKVQAAMAFSQGLNQIMGLGSAFKNLGIVLKSVTGGLRTFRIALISTGIGAIAVAIGFLLEKFDFLGKVIEWVTEKINMLIAPIKQLLQWIGLMKSEAVEAAEIQLETSEKLQKSREREIELAKAQGASAKELRDMEIKMLRERLQAYLKFIAIKIRTGEEVTKEERESIEKLQHELRIALANDARLTEQERQDEAKKEEEARKKRLEAEKKAAEERRILAEAEAKRIAEMERQLQDERIKAIADSREREIEQINLDFKRKIEAVKGNTAVDIELRKQLEENKKIALAELSEKFEKEDAQKELDELKRRFQDAEALVEAQRFQAQENSKEFFQLERELENLRFEQKLETENLTNAEIERLRAEHQAKLNEIDRREGEENIKIQKAIADSKVSVIESTVSSIGAIGALAIKDAKKNEAFQKKLAVVQLKVDTAKSISSTIAGATAAAAAGGPSAPFLQAMYIAQGITTVLGSFAQAKKLLGDSGSAENSNVSNNARAPIIDSTAGPRTPIQRREAIQVDVTAQVVETEMTGKQKRVKNILEDATF